MKIMKTTKICLAFTCVFAILFILTGCTSKDDNNSTQIEEEKQKLDFTNEEPLNLWNKNDDIPYWNDEITPQAITLTPFIASDNENGGCVIICPGGGYNHVTTEKEGYEPAKAFNENGITAFVLNYRVAPYNYEAILSDVFRAIRYVRYYSEDFSIDPNKISVMGFSAGGHLAAMALQHYDEDVQSADAIDKVSAKANYGILCYPVITLTNPYAHKGSRTNFLGKENESDEVLQNKYSAELGISEDMSPCFIWHCKPDTGVPYQNSQMFYDKMCEKNIDCNYHLYDKGGHGLGMAVGHTDIEQWFNDCVDWLRKYGY